MVHPGQEQVEAAGEESPADGVQSEDETEARDG